MKIYDLFEKLSDDTKNAILRNLKEKLITSCKPFLEKHKSDYINGDFLYRGVFDLSNHEIFFEQQTRKDRTPRDSPIDFHYMLNDYFENTFGEPLRSTTAFVTRADLSEGGTKKTYYGKFFIFIPVGNYSLYYGENVVDAYSDIFEKSANSQFKAGFNNVTDNFFKPIGIPFFRKMFDTSEIMAKVFKIAEKEDAFIPKLREIFETLLKRNSDGASKVKILDFLYATNVSNSAKEQNSNSEFDRDSTQDIFYHGIIIPRREIDKLVSYDCRELIEKYLDWCKYSNKDVPIKSIKTPTLSSEIMVDCTSYLLVTLQYAEELVEILKTL